MTAKLTHARSWIDGAWVDSEDVRNSINPATYDIIGTYANGGAKSAEAGIRAAKRAFRETPWPRDRMLRAKVLNQLADAFGIDPSAVDPTASVCKFSCHGTSPRISSRGASI